MGVLRNRGFWLGLVLGWLLIPLVMPSPLHGVVPSRKPS